jgi:SEFIR domain
MESAPREVFISRRHDSPEHEERVLDLANYLRAGGIDCAIDQYVGRTRETEFYARQE